ncbi:MAG TPA: hypothetical protein VEU30_12630 [Thermoanaerobaculia bacterium]|nr:hypothetical protein [Thermoanaerobaculia bacterium]
MRMTRVSIVLLAIAITPPFLGQDEEWRVRNNRGNRYEGSRSVLMAAAPVAELVGLHAYRQPFAPDDAVILDVAFFIDSDASRARLTAREIQREQFYWMEPKRQAWRPGWNRFGPWPVRDVLRRLKIGSGNLAVLARLDGFSVGEGRFAPVFVGTLSASVSVREYDAFFIAARTIERVRWQLKSGGGSILTEGSMGRKLTGAPFTIKLPVDSLPAGLLRLELTCKLESSDSHLTYEFFHQPVMPSGK